MHYPGPTLNPSPISFLPTWITNQQLNESMRLYIQNDHRKIKLETYLIINLVHNKFCLSPNQLGPPQWAKFLIL